MAELINWAFTLAYFAVFLIGLIVCFKEAKLAWIMRNNKSLTIFEKRSYTLKASASLILAIFAILGLIQAVAGV